MHKSRLGAPIVDCQTDDLSDAARFWSEALGLEAESSQDLKNPKYVRLEQTDESAGDPVVILQQVAHPSRVHLDIETDDIEAEVARLTGLGAKLIERLERWAVMEAPSGHRFCVINPNRPGFEANANVWDSAG